MPQFNLEWFMKQIKTLLTRSKPEILSKLTKIAILGRKFF